jgi:inorganic pyrophosphatase
VKKIVLIYVFYWIFFSCSTEKKEITNFSDNYFAIVEIPAGTNKKFEYNYSSKTFEIEIINGVERTINFLPYPGNYGFISNTYMDPELGGDGDALDVLIISESIQQGKNIEINPVAILKLLDRGQEDHKVIATLRNSNMNFSKDSLPNSVRTIIQTWFCNYKGPNKIEFIDWGDKEDAINEIEKWAVKK